MFLLIGLIEAGFDVGSTRTHEDLTPLLRMDAPRTRTVLKEQYRRMPECRTSGATARVDMIVTRRFPLLPAPIPGRYWGSYLPAGTPLAPTSPHSVRVPAKFATWP